MTRDEARELADILAHYADGGEVEYYSICGKEWRLFDGSIDFMSPGHEFRIKPEPKEFYVFSEPCAIAKGYTGHACQVEKPEDQWHPNGDWIRVREVTE